MERHFRTPSAVLLVAVTLVGAVHAELTPGRKLAAKAYIKQFSAREFAARQKAVEELIKMGPDVLPLIKKTLAETKDAEVKLRCRMVIKALEPPWSDAVNGLRMRLSVGNTEVEMGNPVTFHFEFQNVSDAPLRIYKQLSVSRCL